MAQVTYTQKNFGNTIQWQPYWLTPYGNAPEMSFHFICAGGFTNPNWNGSFSTTGNAVQISGNATYDLRATEADYATWLINSGGKNAYAAEPMSNLEMVYVQDAPTLTGMSVVNSAPAYNQPTNTETGDVNVYRVFMYPMKQASNPPPAVSGADYTTFNDTPPVGYGNSDAEGMLIEPIETVYVNWSLYPVENPNQP